MSFIVFVVVLVLGGGASLFLVCFAACRDCVQTKHKT